MEGRRGLRGIIIKVGGKIKFQLGKPHRWIRALMQSPTTLHQAADRPVSINEAESSLTGQNNVCVTVFFVVEKKVGRTSWHNGFTIRYSTLFIG